MLAPVLILIRKNAVSQFSTASNHFFVVLGPVLRDQGENLLVLPLKRMKHMNSKTRAAGKLNLHDIIFCLQFLMFACLLTLNFLQIVLSIYLRII